MQKIEKYSDDGVLNLCYESLGGEIIINDELLLNIMEQYSFLYNCRIANYGDHEFITWGWSRVTETFNNMYLQNTNIKIPPFTTHDLQLRWYTIQSIIQKLPKDKEMSKYSPSLSNIISIVSKQLNEHKFLPASVSESSLLHSIFTSNIAMIEELSPELRLELENEIIDLFLSAELEYKGSMVFSKTQQNVIEQEVENFSQAIQLNECFADLDIKDENLINALNCIPEELSIPDGNKDITKVSPDNTLNIAKVSPECSLNITQESSYVPEVSSVPDLDIKDENLINTLNYVPEVSPILDSTLNITKVSPDGTLNITKASPDGSLNITKVSPDGTLNITKESSYVSEGLSNLDGIPTTTGNTINTTIPLKVEETTSRKSKWIPLAESNMHIKDFVVRIKRYKKSH